MDKFLLAAVLTLTSIAPALAQTNHVRHSQQSVAAVRINATAPLGCVGPYIGTWTEGNPGTGNAC